MMNNEEYPYYRNRKRPVTPEPDYTNLDLAHVVSTQEGYNVIRGILRDLGTFNLVSTNLADIAVHNQGVLLLNDLCQSSPTVAIRLIADVLGILNIQ